MIVVLLLNSVECVFVLKLFVMIMFFFDGWEIWI